MTTWNYRLMRRSAIGETTIAIHEVYYDEDDHIEGWTETPCHPIGNTVCGLMDEIVTMLEAFDKPVLDYESGVEVEIEE